jgi:hypothetical protein
MSLLLLFETPFQIVGGIASGSQAPQSGIAFGVFAPAPEVIVLVLPIQATINLILPIGQTPPVIVPPWVSA